MGLSDSRDSVRKAECQPRNQVHKRIRKETTMERLFGNSFAVLGRSLDYLWQKESVTAANLANVDTPGYKAKYVKFEDMFNAKLRAASGNRAETYKAAKNARWEVKVSETETARLDGNNVVPDTETVELTRAALQYQYVLSSINSDISRLSSVIKG